jgi:hypothetical protein
VKRGSAAELRPCLGQGASWRARVGRVRCLAVLNSFPTSVTVRREALKEISKAGSEDHFSSDGSALYLKRSRIASNEIRTTLHERRG